MKTKYSKSNLEFTFCLVCAVVATFAFAPTTCGQFGGQFTPPSTPNSSTVDSAAAKFNSTPFKVTNPTTGTPKRFGSPQQFSMPKNFQNPKSSTQQPTTRQAKARFPSSPITPVKSPTTGTPVKAQSSFGTQQQGGFSNPISRPLTRPQPDRNQLPGTPAKSTSFPTRNGGLTGSTSNNQSASEGSTALPDTVECDGSSVHFISDIKLPAKEAGEIRKMNFKEGDFVRAGQIIAQINDEVALMMLEEAELNYKISVDKAENSTASLAARKKWDLASIEAKKTARLAASGSKSESEKMMANYTKEIAFLEMKKADEERRIALTEAKRALAQKRQVQTRIARHTIRSNFDGYIVELKKKEQEYVQTGEEVIRLARMDRLYVQSVVDFRDLNAHELMNRSVTITVPLARGESATFEGQIKFVGLERQGPELLMVKAEVQNRSINDHWVLHPEAEVQMTIHLNETPSSFGSASNTKVTR